MSHYAVWGLPRDWYVWRYDASRDVYCLRHRRHGWTCEVSRVDWMRAAVVREHLRVCEEAHLAVAA